MQLPQRCTAKVTNKDPLCWKVTKLTVEYLEPPELIFDPGQFISLKVGDTCYRAYSICSDYKNPKSLSLIIETGHDGKGSNFTKTLNIGDTLAFIGPSGRYRLKQPYEKNITFLSTGTGIAPFVPMFYKLVDDKFTGEVTLFQGFRKDEDVFFIDLLNYFKSNLSNFNYKIFISQNTSNPSYIKGRINDDLSQIIKPDTHYYICGHPGMVTQTKSVLLNMKVNIKNILNEEFTHSKQ